MKSEKYAIFLDIDDTLLYQGAVPQANIEAIKKVRAQGSYVFINTARSYGCIQDELLKTVELDGIVAGIGTDLRLGGKQVFSRTMSNEDLKEITNLFIDCGREVSYEGEDIMLWINPQEWRNADHFVKSASDFDTVYKDAKISKMYIRGQLTEDETESLSRKYTVFQHDHYAEFVNKGFSKAAGMKKMCELISVPTERTIAMGDSSNDIDMLKSAGIAVAMGNAINEVKEICDFISCDAKDGGVAKALKKLILE